MPAPSLRCIVLLLSCLALGACSQEGQDRTAAGRLPLGPIAADQSCRFAIGYDGWSLTPEPAVGGSTCSGFSSPDLQLRMFPGVGGKGGGLKMRNDERCEYPLAGNLDPQRGTISLWVSPQTWKASDDRFQVFVTARDRGWKMIVYKYYQYSRIMFYLEVDRGPGLSPRRFSVSADAKDDRWRPGLWRRIDATWDLARGLRLSVDGVRPSSGEPVLDFTEPVLLPAPTADGRLIIGGDPAWRTNPHWRADDETAFDEIRIRDRMLSSDEILAGYREVFPSDFSIDPRRATVPVPAGAEWSLATRIPLLPTGAGDGSHGWAELRRMGDQLQVRLRGNTVSGWEVDGGGIVLESSSPQHPGRFLSIDASGGTSSSFAAGRAEAVVDRDRDGAFLGFRIPLAAEDASAVRATVRMHLRRGEERCVAGWPLPVGSVGGRLVFAGAVPGVRVERLGDLGAGLLDLSVSLMPVGGASVSGILASYEIDGGGPVAYPGDLRGRSWRIPLPSGRQKLVLAAADPALPFHYEAMYEIVRPFDLSYSCHPSQGFITVDCGAPVRRPAVSATGALSLVAVPSGAEVVRIPLPSAPGPGRFRLPLPAAGLVPGEYAIEARLPALDGCEMVRRERLRVPEPPAMAAVEAADLAVPPPWEPVRQLESRTYAVWGRRYVFANGPFPAAIDGDGRPILTGPIELIADFGRGPQAVPWGAETRIQASPRVVSLAGTASVDGIVIDWSTELWFDGVCRSEFTMRPGKTVRIESLSLRYGIAPECARFVLTPLLTPWTGDRIELPFQPEPGGQKDCSVWITGDDRGLFWWPESDANWRSAPGSRPIRLVRSPAGVSVDLRLIDDPADLRVPARYAMAFMGSPARPLPTAARSFREGGWGAIRHQSHQVVSWSSFGDRVQDDDCVDPVGHRPFDRQSFARAMRRWRAAGIVPLPYGQPTYLGTAAPEADYHAGDWAQVPGRTFGGTKAGVPYQLLPCCPNSGFADHLVSRSVAMLTEQPDVGGLYYDLSWATFCANPAHGCGGTDAFGKAFSTSTAWGLRNALRRIYAAAHARGAMVMHHNHSLFNPICHNFTDVWYPGEQYEPGIAHAKEPGWFYGEAIPREVYQSELSMRIKGVGLSFLPQFQRAVELTPSLKARADAGSDEYTIRTMTPLLLHDIPVSGSWMTRAPVERWWGLVADGGLDSSVFTGYWQDSLVSADHPDVLVSRYACPGSDRYRLVLVVGNLSREPASFSIGFDAQALGLGAGPFRVDPLIGAGQPAVEGCRIGGLSLAGHHHLVVGIR